MQCLPFLTGAAHFDHLVECCPLSSLDNYLSLSPLQLISSLRGWQDHWNTWLQIRISPHGSVWIDDFWLIQYLPWWTNCKWFSNSITLSVFTSQPLKSSLLLCVFIYLYIIGMNSCISFFFNNLFMNYHIYLGAQTVSGVTSGRPFKVTPVSLWQVPSFVNTSLLPGLSCTYPALSLVLVISPKKDTFSWRVV